MNKGFYLKELLVIGKDVEPAQMSFDRGLNVLSGASNTGKTYVFSLIKYMFGGHAPPKDIKEAKDYFEIRVQLNTYDGQLFTISRKFGDNQIYIAECSIDEFDNIETKKFSAQHSSKDENNISYFLLNLIGLNNKKLKINARNEKREIRFSDLVKLCLISETLIISEISPIFSGQYTEKTVEESVFKLILSGMDDDELEAFEDPKIYKNKLRGKIEFINESIENKRKYLSKIISIIKDLELEEINIKINEFTKMINESRRGVMEEEQKRSVIWKDVESLRYKITQIEELEKRFILLNTHYNSDIKRLEFINEGKQYLDQLKNVNCPLCGSLVKQGYLTRYDEEESDRVLLSLQSEVSKIGLKQKELSETLNQLNEEKKELTERYQNKKDDFERIEKYISNSLKKIVEINQEKLENFLKLKDDKSKIEILKEEISTLEKDKIYYQAKLDEKIKKATEREIASGLYNSLTDEIKKILNAWGMDCKTVYFDKTEKDIEIDGKPRKHFGKGFRAIYLSAFMIGLMRYCLVYNKYHPFFLILDSPLTTYKEQDRRSDNDKISEDTQNLFFISLSKYEHNQDLQIFIIDNKEPPTSIKSDIKYEHFSRNKNVGRYGFYPIN